ncbi:vWA domain-containing protein [Mesorhizobium sp. KR9-304]|uniref:vWA domain-containing protein n=1 Tax=Mesorhizobium sp. KR9-304 TaxID=3156614 RepID=UPI0032B47D88
MSKKRLYVHILLDRSGSMEECRDSTISAFNEYVNSLAADAGLSARISLTLFDDRSIDLVFDRQKPGEMPKLTKETFVPRGMTPLNDAIAGTVAEIDKADLRKDESVTFVILTDGLENASREHTKQTIKLLLERRQKEKNWLVIYLGANQDAFAEGAARGMAADNTMTFDAERVEQAVGAAARASMAFAHSPVRASAAFTPAERAKARR